jgi:sporulation protein YlmC with PRC-barrel domain
MIAAVMTAANLGTRVTGWGFAVFAVGAVAWMIVGAATGQRNLLISNGFLLLVDLIGVWRWLGQRARYDSGAEAARRRSARAATPDLFALSKLEGMSVRAPDGTTVGSVVDAMATCDRASVAYLVVREGGVGGVGERLRALGWDEVRLRADGLDSQLDSDQLQTRPTLTADAWPATRREAGIG